MTQTPVRIGVVGLGDFGLRHAKTLVGLGEAELVALVTRSLETLESAQLQLPDIRGWTDLETAINESTAEAWVVASATHVHVAQTQQLLTAGQAVLLEKPVATNLSEAEQLRSLVENRSANLMIGHIVLFNSEFQELLKLVHQQKEIVLLDCVRHRPALNLRRSPPESPLHLTMVHDLYCAQALFGGAEPDHFSAQLHYMEGHRVDLATAELRFPSGGLARFAASYLTPPGMPGDGFDRMEVFGHSWSGRINPNPRPLEWYDNRARWPMELEIRDNPLAATGMLAEELRCFCRVVRGVEAVPTGARYKDAMQVQRWLAELETVAMT